MRSLLSARRSSGLHAGETVAAGSVVATTLALTWFNPHVYLDTVLMLGSIANQHGPQERWWFGGGAMVASLGAQMMLKGRPASDLSLPADSSLPVTDVQTGLPVHVDHDHAH